MAGEFVVRYSKSANNPNPPTMQLTVKTLLRSVQELAGFVIREIKDEGTGKHRHIAVFLEPHPRRKARCGQCLRPAPGYDSLHRQPWHFVPLWNIAVRLHYAPRRVQCPSCGVRVEHMPWNVGKRRYAKALMVFLARWAKHLSWKQTAAMFRTNWEAVRSSVEWVVEHGLAHRSLEGVRSLGVDEIHWGRGKRSANYVTLIYQIDAGARRLLYVGHRRTQAALKKGFAELEGYCAGFLKGITVICSDMWKPYLKVIAQKAGWALNILDPFHISKHLNEALDKVRRGEQGRMPAAKIKEIKRNRFVILKRGTRVRGKARLRLNATLRVLRLTARVWQLKEAFRQFWTYRTEWYAGAFLSQWIQKALRSRAEPLKKVARMLQRHEPLLLNYFRAKRQFTNAVTEGLNHKARVALARSYGHRSFQVLQLVLYHTLGDLPEPQLTHTFC
jgi:transposase